MNRIPVFEKSLGNVTYKKIKSYFVETTSNTDIGLEERVIKFIQNY